MALGVSVENKIERDPHIVCANLSHLDAIVQIHLAAFEGFFLEFLGMRFLKELYRGFLEEPACLCLVAIDRNDVVGFAVGTTEPEEFFRRLLRRRWPRFVSAGAGALILHPLRVGKKFLLALRYRGERPQEVPNATLLSSIGVIPGGRGKGIGRILISSFCDMAQISGASAVFLTTDRYENEAVNEFYLSNEFKLHSYFLKERNRWMNLYTCSLLDRQSTSQISSLRKARGR